MGNRGPAPAPTAAKVRKGETRPSRINQTEPLPRRAMPTMPKGMGDAAEAVWKHVIQETRSADMILAADADVLRCYCEAVARYVAAAEMYAKTGPLIRSAHHGGELVKTPLHQVVRDHADQVRLFARELGLSPSARASLQVAQSPNSSDIEDVLGPPPRLRVVGGANA